MDPQQQEIITDLEGTVCIIISKYKKSNDVTYLKGAIESLEEILDDIDDHESCVDLTEFKSRIKGMLDELKSTGKLPISTESADLQNTSVMVYDSYTNEVICISGSDPED